MQKFFAIFFALFGLFHYVYPLSNDAQKGNNSNCTRRVIGFFNPGQRQRNFTFEQASVMDYLILHVVSLGSDNVARFVYDVDKKGYDFYLETLRIARQVPSLKVMVSVGGDQSFSDFFPSTMNDTQERASLVQNLANLMNSTGLSGVNIWWNQPVIDGFMEDRANYVKFLGELRAVFNTFPRQMVISILTTKSDRTISHAFELGGIGEHVDFIMSMSYGYNSPRMQNNFTGPCNPIYKSRPDETDYLHRTMKVLACGSGRPNKVNVGLGFYAWLWGRVSNQQLWDMDDMFLYKKGMAFDSQFMRWRMVSAKFNLSLAKYHDRAKTMYYHDPEREIYIGTENERSFWGKLHYVDEYGLGGVSISAIDGDDDNDTLFNIIKSWKQSPCVEKIAPFRCTEEAEDVVTNPVYFPLNVPWLQKQRQCCDSFVMMNDTVEATNHSNALNCASLDLGKSPAIYLVDESGNGNALYRDYFQRCVLENGTANVVDCCEEKGVDPDCMAICRMGESNLSVKQLAHLYKSNCSIRAQEMATHCTFLHMEWARKLKNGDNLPEPRKKKIKRWLKDVNKKMKYEILLASLLVSIVAIMLIVPLGSLLYRRHKLRVAMDTSLKLGQILGKGKYGTVYEARWLSKKVAAKVLSADSSRELKHEYSILKSFDHENICRVEHVALVGNRLALIMEFAELGDLQTYLHVRGPSVLCTVGSVLDAAQLTQIAKMIAKGMNYLSQKKTVHRDLACRNCLVFNKLTGSNLEVADGANNNNAQELQIVVKISDFGLARNLGEKKSYYGARWIRWLKAENAILSESEENVQDLCGAPSDYIPIPKLPHKLPTLNAAPECLKNRKFTMQSDIWSFGILLVEIFSYGQLPYTDLSFEKAVDEILAGRLPSMPEHMPTGIEALMRSCCRLELDDRILIGEVLDELERLTLVDNNGPDTEE